MIEEVAFGGPDPILVWRLRGRGDGPSAHLQAGVHADEIPPMLVLHHLLQHLLADEAAGRLRGDVTVVPQCNPIGIRQIRHARLLGRFDEASGHNFNRAFADAAARAAEQPVFAWQAALLALVGDAAIVLDLHTDDEALPYLYVDEVFWPQAADLAACVGARVAITWHGGGGGAFEDAIVQSWRGGGRLAGRLCSTVELRGQADVDDATAMADADSLHLLLRSRGVIDGPAALPAWCGPTWHGEAVPIAHIQTVRAPCSGVVAFCRGLGDRLAVGEAFAQIVPRPGAPDSDMTLVADHAGMILTRMRDRYVAAGGIVAKLTGDAPSAGWGDAPLDD